MRVTSQLALIGLLLLTACSTDRRPAASSTTGGAGATPRAARAAGDSRLTPNPTAVTAIAIAPSGMLSSTPQARATTTATPASPSQVPVQDTSFTCRVTVANGSNPPGERPSTFRHGNGALWTALWRGGIVLMSPEYVLPDGSFSMKFPWWLGEKARGKLTIQGRRLDVQAPPLQAEISSGSVPSGVSFNASDIIFPTEGCWEVTSKAGNARLTFVTLVLRTPVQVEYPPKTVSDTP